MKEIIVGADGFIGSNLAQLVPEAICTTRKPAEWGAYSGPGGSSDAPKRRFQLDLLALDTPPAGDLVWLCAGVNGQKRCEGNPESHHVNVDATIRLAKLYVEQGAFVVWISSRSLEWCASAYSRQKAMAETVLTTMPVGIVRAGRVTPANVLDLCATLIRVGRARAPGLTVWGTDDISYQK